jgi:FecR protein
MMNARYTNILRVVSLFTIFCILHIYVLVGSVSAATIEVHAPTVPSASGTLKTTNNQAVIVNGNSVRPGTTILTGSTIETPAGVGATIQLASGDIAIAPNSEVTVDFTGGRSEVSVKRGYAFPEPVPGSVPQQLIARLTTQNNQAITVNGSAVTGGAILTGATIETPDQVSATIDLGDGSVVQVGPNSLIKIDFDQDGNVRVKVVRGCVMTNKRSSVLPGEMEVYTDTASIKTDKNRKQAGGCILPSGQLGPFSGAGAAAAGGGGISTTVLGILLAAAGAGVIAAILVAGGSNPSPSNP